MSRKAVRVSIKMRPNKQLYVCQDLDGTLIVYEDQMPNIMSVIAICRTRDEALEKLSTFGNGLDLHHGDVKNLIPRKVKKRTLRAQKHQQHKEKALKDRVKYVDPTYDGEVTEME